MKNAAHIPLADQNMRGHLKDRQQSWARVAKELDKTLSASPPPTPEPGRRYVTADEACADLGLDAETKIVAQKEMRALVSEQKAGFSVAKTLREQGVRQPIIRELLTRGMRMVTEMRAARAVTDLYVKKGGGGGPPGAGWSPIPKGKKGGYRRPKSGGGYEYAYPDAEGGYTSHNEPAADESLSVHEEHESETPEGKVRERMAQMSAKAKAAGLDFTGKATSRTTMKHLNELEKQLDRAIKQKQAREKAEKDGTAPPKRKLTDADVHATPAGGKTEPKPADPPKGDNAPPGASDGEPVTVREKQPEEPGFAIPPRPGTDEPKGDNAPAAPKDEPTPKDDAAAQRATRERKIHDTAEGKGVPKEEIEKLLNDPDFQTEDGAAALQAQLDALPDLPPPAELPDEVPTDDKARKGLEHHAAKLEETIARMEKALSVERDAHAKELAQLREQVKRLAERPTPRKAAEATHATWVACLLIFGFVAGALFAGPMGALLGASMASHWVKTGVAKSLRRPRLGPGLYLAKGFLVLVKSEDDDVHARTARENDPARIVASRAAILRELADAPAPAGDEPRHVVQVLDDHSDTWARVSRYLSPDNRRKVLTAASALLSFKAAPATQADEPVAKGLPAPPTEPPPEAPRIRARHGENEHGHRDGLVPGQKLTVRKGAPGPELVEVLPDGHFRWGDDTYANGRQLLKALTGREDHKLTVRRYFGLEADDARLAKALSDALRARHPALLVSPYQGRVRVEGPLARYNIPVDHPADTTVLLDLSAVQTLLAPATE